MVHPGQTRPTPRGGSGPFPIWLVFLAVFGAWKPLERRSASIEAGNALMKAGKAEDALGAYDKAAQELATEPGVHFDRGTALAALSRFDEAAQEFLRATEAKDPAVKAAAFYNLGNAFFKKDKFKEAFEAYKRSLTLEPGNTRAKWNAELALEKQRQEDKKKQDQKNDQKSDDQKKKKDDQKDKDDKKQKDQNDKNDKKQEDQKHQKDQKDQPEPKPNEPDKEGDQKPKPSQPADDSKDKDAPQEQPPAADTRSADEREMESALDGLDKSPKDLEKQRAMLRAVRRAPPTRDW